MNGLGKYMYQKIKGMEQEPLLKLQDLEKDFGESPKIQVQEITNKHHNLELMEIQNTIKHLQVSNQL